MTLTRRANTYRARRQPYRVWATKRDLNLRDQEESGGARGEITRRWRIRWNEAIYESTLSLVMINDGGRTFNVQNMVEVTGSRREQQLRRRFMELTGVFTT